MKQLPAEYAFSVIAVIISFFVWRSYVISYTFKRWKSGPFWGCQWLSHPWHYACKKADIPEHIRLPPTMVIGMHQKIRTIYGEQEFRYCPCCKRLQIQKLDFSGCLSITDPPGVSWEDIDNIQLNI